MGRILRTSKEVRKIVLEYKTAKYFGKKTSLKHKKEENSSIAQQQESGAEITNSDPTDHTDLKKPWMFQHFFFLLYTHRKYTSCNSSGYRDME